VTLFPPGHVNGDNIYMTGGLQLAKVSLYFVFFVQ